MRTLKNEKVANILAEITNRILNTGKVPSSFRKARTILVHKRGNPADLDNWRPISITLPLSFEGQLKEFLKKR